jgi:predicted ATP-grasp superfamily ATP-dependent carboligase
MSVSSILLVGIWGPTSLAFVRSCHRQGLRVYLLEVGDGSSVWRRYSSCLTGGDRIGPEKIGTPEGIRLIRDYVSLVGAQAVVTADDVRMLWLAQNRVSFEPACRLLIPAAETLEFVSSKRNQIELATRVGFNVLPTFYLSTSSNCRNIPSELYPMVVRPDCKLWQRWPFKVELISSPMELETFMRALDCTRGLLVLQPFLSLPNMVVHGVRTETGTILTMQAFVAPRKFEGVTLTIMPAVFPPNVEQYCRDFVESAGVTGCFHFELLFSPYDNRAWFLEINVRLGGTTDKVTRLGFDETSYLLSAYGIKPIPSNRPSLLQASAADKRALLKHIIWAVRGDLTELDYPPSTRMRHVWRSLRDLWTTKDSIFSLSDLRGAFWWSPPEREYP